jgi:hypothetical protein
MQKQGKWGSDWMRMNVMESRVSLVLATFPFLVSAADNIQTDSSEKNIIE